MFGLKRDPEYVQSQLVFKDNQVFCKEACYIEYPVWFENKDFANVEESYRLLGLFAIVIGGKFSVSIIPSKVQIDPVMAVEVDREGVKYIQLHFGKGDCIVSNLGVSMNAQLGYPIVEAFYLRANIPWYLTWYDLVRVLDNFPKYAGSNVGANFMTNELIVSYLTRPTVDKSKFYRQVGTTGDYGFVDLMNLYYSVSSVTNKLAGGYMKDSIISAIVNPPTRETQLDKHMKG